MRLSQGRSLDNNFWYFIFIHQETTYTNLQAMLDWEIPRSYRMMQGFGVNIYCLVNKRENDTREILRTPYLGMHSLVWVEGIEDSRPGSRFRNYLRWKFGFPNYPRVRRGHV